MSYLGLMLDEKKNKEIKGKEEVISSQKSRVTVMVVPTNEELVIAQDTLEIVINLDKN